MKAQTLGSKQTLPWNCPTSMAGLVEVVSQVKYVHSDFLDMEQLSYESQVGDLESSLSRTERTK